MERSSHISATGASSGPGTWANAAAAQWPPGFREASRHPSKAEEPWECDVCAALTFDPDKHRRWHELDTGAACG